MTQIEQLTNAIQKLIEESKTWTGCSEGFAKERIDELKGLLSIAKTSCQDPEIDDLGKASRHYLLNEHNSPLNEIMHKADLKAEMQYHTDIENAFESGSRWKEKCMMRNAAPGELVKIYSEDGVSECVTLYIVMDENKKLEKLHDSQGVKVIIFPDENE